jgi:hypothetical protein
MKLLVNIEIDEDWWLRMSKQRIGKKLLLDLIGSSINFALLGRGHVVKVKEDLKNN